MIKFQKIKNSMKDQQKLKSWGSDLEIINKNDDRLKNFIRNNF